MTEKARRGWRFGLVLLSVATAPHLLHGQEVPPADTTAAGAQRDTVDPELARGPSRSPRGAFLRSLVLPGWGQAWVGARGRGGVYFALAGGSGWMLYKSRRGLDQARDQEEFLREIGELGEDQNSGLVEAREQQVEDWTALTLFLFFFSAADAYVAAHLADIDDYVGVEGRPGGDLEVRIDLPLPGRHR